MRAFDLFSRQRGTAAVAEELADLVDPVDPVDPVAPAAAAPWPVVPAPVPPAPPAWPAPVEAARPVVEEPVDEQPVAEEPVAEEPVIEEPVAEQPATDEPVAEQPATDEPVADEPVAEEPAPAPSDLDAEIAAHWDLWAGQIGRALRPDLEGLKDRVPALVSAMVTTVDGTPLATVGLDDDQVTRLTESSVSVHAAARSVVGILGESTEGPDVITVHHGQQQTVVVTVPQLLVGTLLLWVTADAASLGVLLIHARNTAAAIRTKLAADSTDVLATGAPALAAQP